MALAKIHLSEIFQMPVTPGSFGPEETVLGYVEGWRWWRHTFADGKIHLHSVNDGIEWNIDGENVADRPPAIGNTNGFYAYTIGSVERHEPSIFGRVALYGDVVHHRRGYRAEKARILDLWIQEDVFAEEAEVALMAMPQVKGVFHDDDPAICDSTGAQGGYRCLTLVNLKELSGTNLSDGPTMTVIAKKARGVRFWYLNAIPSLFANRSPSPLGEWRAYWDHRPWVYEPEGLRCDRCNEIIKDDQFIIKEFKLPDNWEHLLWDKSFRWKEVVSHGDCTTRFWTMTDEYAFSSSLVQLMARCSR